MNWEEFKKVCQKTWHFIWYDDSLASWIINIILVFVLIKFIVYPLLGLMLGTSFPVVAVISGSMEHNGDAEAWWESSSPWYLEHSIGKEEFMEYPFTRGFNKGDIMILAGVSPEDVKRGDVLVFQTTARKEPIIHRVVIIEKQDGNYVFQTKGDNVPVQHSFETSIASTQVIGKAVFRIPFLGYIKLGFVSLLRLLHVPGV